jgi:SAM-dependent methyltransferase
VNTAVSLIPLQRESNLTTCLLTVNAMLLKCRLKMRLLMSYGHNTLQMNIADKKRLYSEMHRVLKPGGKLAIYDVFKGSNSSDVDGSSSSSIHFPVPWASDPSISHLIPTEEGRNLLKEVVGIKEVAWEDKTESVVDWIKQMMKPAQTSGPPPTGLHVLVGPQWSDLVKNLLRNLEEGRITVAQGIFERS